MARSVRDTIYAEIDRQIGLDFRRTVRRLKMRLVDAITAAIREWTERNGGGHA